MLIIANWDKIFENNRSREIKRLEWVAIPNRHDGSKYAELLDHHDGAAHFGAWCAIVQVASSCGETAGSRGILRRGDGNPHTAKSLAHRTRIPAAIFEAAIPRLVELGWLQDVAESYEKQDNSVQPAEIPHAPAGFPPLGAPHGRARGGKGKEDELKNPPPSPRELFALIASAWRLYPATRERGGREGSVKIQKGERERAALESAIRARPTYPWLAAIAVERQRGRTVREVRTFLENPPLAEDLEPVRQVAASIPMPPPEDEVTPEQQAEWDRQWIATCKKMGFNSEGIPK